MSTLQTRSFQSIVSKLAAGMQGRVGAFLNFAIGSVLRAIAEAVGGVALWLQGQALVILKLNHLNTSYGSDADDWLADYGIVTRLGAQKATGLVVFSRYTASSASPLILVGTQVQTQDGSTRFEVYADPSNPSYSAALNGYVLPAQITSLVVPVQALVAGAAGNVGLGSITLIGAGAPSGIDKVTNPGALTNGIDQEDDETLKARFRGGIQSLSKGTRAAITFAIQSLRTGMQVTIQENVALDGTPTPGFITVVVDDGSGNISASLLAACQTAVADDVVGIRAASIRVAVVPAQVATATVVYSMVSETGYYHPNVVAAVDATLALKINGSGLGNGLAYFDLAAWARDTPGCAKLLTLTLNGGQADIPPLPAVTVKAGQILGS